VRKGDLPAVIALLALAAAAVGHGEAWRQVGPDLGLDLPRDHGAHPQFRTEWWYLTGIVRTESGRSYGLQLTFFRRGLDDAPPGEGESSLRARQAIAAHFALADPQAAATLHAARLRRAVPPLAAAAVDDLAVSVDGWKLVREADGTLTARARAVEQAIAVQLTARPEKPLVRHGAGGYSRKGPEPGNASAYLSWTRLALSGTLEVAGRTLPFSGEGWFDHEWGTSQLAADVVGWDWFGLRLADGRDLMAFRLRRADGTASPFSAGTVVAADGSARPLGAAELEITDTAQWTSPHTGAVYPAGWRIRVPGAGLDLEVAPLVADAEIPATGSTGTVYWEGPVEVRGSVAGEGYAELTGYAGTMAGRF